MNILMLLNEEFPPDSRVLKEAISLINGGHKVTIACYTRMNLSSSEIIQGIEIRRISISNWSYKLSAACLVVPYYFWLWKLFIGRIINESIPDVIHVHDLPLSKVGYYFKRKIGCKLVCDQHEYYSDWIIHTAHMNTILGKIVKFLGSWSNYEKKYLKKADLVITVADPLRDMYIENYNIKENKIVTVPNTPSLNIYKKENVKGEITKRFRNDFVIFYAGGIDILRGIDTVIKSLPLLKREIPNIKFLLVGKIIKPFDPFEVAKAAGVEHLLQFDGWVDEEDLPSYISASSVCVFTPPSNRDEINNTIATKIYQYTIMGKPIITSNAKMMKDFVKTNNLGFSITDGDYSAFAEAVLKCRDITLSELTEKRKVNMSWERTVTPMLNKYQELIES